MEETLLKLVDKSKKEISAASTIATLNSIFLNIFGQSGTLMKITKELKHLSEEEKPKIGALINRYKKELENAIKKKKARIIEQETKVDIDVTIPGIRPPLGHLHLVTQAILQISRIFEKIGFTRVRYPEIDWEWYSFESLNMTKDSPARDDFETFFIEADPHPKFGKMVLSPHTSSGQVREMERVGSPPIRMINIAKCYRPNWDISHTPMFHQFEGLVIDKSINITHLKGTFDYFARVFFGPKRKIRLRPFHFQFTEPSFEVDITCGVCDGKGCKLCKEGWLELGGSGMVHPNVLKAGKIDPNIYTGYAFGWGIERTYMMKEGLKIEDLRLLYSNDTRFLDQF
ncbi:phenylalanine--tRNA ligase subunit alpha [Candidatus Gottesmanbacteria bacterium RIFCSPLOWO2_01_FULL_39_12b]|uniref:Phenylalanine--tRNA ligase alpha subunit n=1 Tax=Candidatus Gottesmanbacteria bacterium RIFCSPLOWO2_01_FULL_39_12b TaxID=1798388 RepID=A0A1F6AQE9_9BACT|nr:MAG: phenylalanine--tRNA ligase subunit alpha [Candidatus Gottesmanbacteria bacterium RIFCSPLOWO2_01_FULL_39_12b]